jgi:hypothetical protein
LKPIAAENGSKRLQFIASVKIATRRFDEGRSPTECMRDIKQALKVLEKEKRNVSASD